MNDDIERLLELATKRECQIVDGILERNELINRVAELDKLNTMQANIIVEQIAELKRLRARVKELEGDNDTGR